MKKETYIIGDIHGCYDTLMNLINKLPINAELIFVGDLVDKGINSKKVLEFVINNNYQCIKGNHEKYMEQNIEDALYKNIDSKWSTDTKSYGGPQTLENYENDDSFLQKHLSWIRELPSFLIIDNYFITHGFGLPYYIRRNEEKSKKIMLTNRLINSKYEEDWEDTTKYEIINVFGHCQFKEVKKGRNYFGIDTGCVYNNKLTALKLGTNEIVEVNTHKNDLSDIPNYLD